MLFDASTDLGPAREVPLEAHRRFRADLRARRERNQQERDAQLALHEEKKRQKRKKRNKDGKEESADEDEQRIESMMD